MSKTSVRMNTNLSKKKKAEKVKASSTNSTQPASNAAITASIVSPPMNWATATYSAPKLIFAKDKDELDKTKAVITGTASADTKTAIEMNGGTNKANIKLFCAYLLDKMWDNPSTEQSISFLSYISFLLHIIQQSGSPGLTEAWADFMEQAKQKNWFQQHGIVGCENIKIEDIRNWILSNKSINTSKVINFSGTNLDTFAHNTLLRKIVDDVEKLNLPLNVSSTNSTPHYQYLVEIFLERLFLVLNTAEKKKFDFFKKIIVLFMSFPIGAIAQTERFIKILNKKMMEELSNLSLDDILSVLKINQHIGNVAGIKLFDSKEKAEILERILPIMTNDKVPILMDLQWGFFKDIPPESLKKLSQYLFDHGNVLQDIELPWERGVQDSIYRLIGSAVPGDVKLDGEASKLNLPHVEKLREDSIIKAVSELNKTLKMSIPLDMVRLGAAILCAKLLNYIGTFPITRDSMVHVIYITFLLDTLYKPAGKGPDLKAVFEYFLKVSKKMGWFERLQMPECNGVTPENILARLLLGADITNKMNFLRSTNLFRYGKSVALPKIIDSEFGSDMMVSIDRTFNPRQKIYDIFLVKLPESNGKLTLAAVKKYEEFIPLLIEYGDEQFIYGLDFNRAPKLTNLGKKILVDKKNKIVAISVPQRLESSDVNTKIFRLISEMQGHCSSLLVNDMLKAHYGNWVASLMPSLFGVLQNPTLVARSTEFNFVCPFSGLILNFPVNPLEVQFNYFIKDIVRYAILNPGYLSEREIFPILKLIEYFEVKTGKKLLKKEERGVLLKCMVSSQNWESRNGLIMRFQWTMFNYLPKEVFSSMENIFDDYYKKHTEIAKKQENDHPWEKEFCDALSNALPSEERKSLMPNYICPDTGKELDIVYINNSFNIKIVFHLDGSSHYYLDRDDENYETLARNQALENAGWINFCFKLKSDIFEPNQKVKKEVVEEFVQNAKRVIQDSLLKLKPKSGTAASSAASLADYELKHNNESRHATNVSAAQSVDKKYMGESTSTANKPPLLFSFVDYQTAIMTSPTVLNSAAASSAALDSKSATEKFFTPIQTATISLCNLPVSTAAQEVDRKAAANVVNPLANAVHASAPVLTYMHVQKPVAPPIKSSKRKKKPRKVVDNRG